MILATLDGLRRLSCLAVKLLILADDGAATDEAVPQSSFQGRVNAIQEGF
jgi:hypothetical protein